MADLYYYESGYIDASYFVYTADAEAVIESSSTLTATVGVIKEAQVTLTVTTSVTATLSHIYGADLFAMSSAALAAEVSRIRDNNIAVSSVFSISTDASRTVNVSSSEDDSFNITITNARLRATEAAIDAAFSLDVAGLVTRTTTALLESTTSLSVGATVEIGATNGEAALTATSELSASFDRVRDTNSSIDSTTSLSTNVSAIRTTTALLESTTLVSADPTVQIGPTEAQADLTSSCELSVSVAVTRTTNIALDSNTNLGSSISRISASTIDCQSLFNPNISCQAITNTFAVLDSTSTLAIDYARSRDSATDMAASTMLAADVQAQRQVSTDAVASSELSSTALRIQLGLVDCQALFSPSIDCVATVNSLAVLSSSFAVLVDVTRIRDVDSLQSSSMSVDVSGVRTTDTSSEITATASLDVGTIEHQKSFQVTISSSLEISTTAYRIKQFVISEAGAFTPSISCNVTVNSFAVLESRASVTANLNKIQTVTSSISTTSSLAAAVVKLGSNIIDISLTSSISAVGIRTIRKLVDPSFIGQAVVNNNIVEPELFSSFSLFRISEGPIVSGGGSGLSPLAKFGQSLKFDARGASTGISHGPVYGSAGYIAIRANFEEQTTYISSSTDGVTWTEVSHNLTIPTTKIVRLRYTNGKYFAIGGDGTSNGYTYISYSTDGSTWTNLSTNTLGQYTKDIIWSGNQYLLSITQSNGTAYVYSSTDLTTWSARTTRTPAAQFNNVYYNSFAVSGTSVIAVGETYDAQYSKYVPYYAYSSNRGTNWTNGTIGPNGGASAVNKRAKAIASNGSTWVMIGTGGMLYTSTNMSTWTSQTSGTTADLYSIEYANGNFVISGNGLVLTSTNATTWTNRTVPVVANDSILYRSNGIINSTESTPTYALGQWLFNEVKTTDLTNWSIVDYQIINKQAFLQYPDDAGWATWKTMDLWLNIDGAPSAFSIYGIASQVDLATGHAWSIYAQVQASNSVAIRIIAGGGAVYDLTRTITTSFTFSEWNHIRIVNNNGVGSLFVNGTRNGTTFSLPTTWGDNPTALNIGYTAWASDSAYARYSDYYIDEFMLTDESLATVSDTTITVPTTPWPNTEATDINLHFDVSYADDPTWPYRLGNAALTVNASLDGSLIANKKLVSNQTSSSNLTGSLIKIVEATAGLTSQFTQTTDIKKIKSASANLVVQAFELVSQATIRGFGAVISSSTSLSSTVTKTFGPITSNLISTSSLTANVIRVKEASVDMIAFAASLVLESRTRGDVADLVVSSSLTADAVVIRRASSQLTGQATVNVTSLRIKDFSVSWTALASELVVNRKQAGLTANLSVISSLTVSAKRTRNGQAALNCQASMSASVSILQIVRVALVTESSMLTITGVKASAEAYLQALAFELVSGRTINLEASEVWIIPSESRYWTISTETAEWTIPFEDRTYKIKG